MGRIATIYTHLRNRCPICGHRKLMHRGGCEVQMGVAEDPQTVKPCLCKKRW